MAGFPQIFTRQTRWSLIVICSALIAACSSNGTVNSRSLSPLHQGVKAPKGVNSVSEAVDGLVVGHRLMASGEYELALKAYRRAAGEQGLNADVLSALGSANLKLGRLHQAEEMLRIAVSKDNKFVPAWNNLGVVLLFQGNYGEAKQVFQLAYALDNGDSEEIRANLTKTIAIIESSGYSTPNKPKEFELVRRGNGRYLLLSTPNSG
ncbi:MAG: tetratricopeptide repeat protein [Rhodobacteraceae bacterium]|nr:tetratricopeptide repeat protein [Paracoccaceae bacterium]